MHILISNHILVDKLNWPAGSGHKKRSVKASDKLIQFMQLASDNKAIAVDRTYTVVVWTLLQKQNF